MGFQNAGYAKRKFLRGGVANSVVEAGRYLRGGESEGEGKTNNWKEEDRIVWRWDRTIVGNWKYPMFIDRHIR